MATLNSDLTIGEVARQAGVPASTLRYWESAGLLAAPGRVGGKRRYGPQALRQISLIVLIKRVGFTLAETRIVLSGLSDRTPPPEIWRKLAERKLPEIKQTLAEARAMKKILEEGLRCDCLTLDDCLRQGESWTAAHRRVPTSAQK
ncbi:MAG TPA: MerR family transcriptional regulator [Solirubrobacteraceae bacterium]|jgi:MerR family redox-sensitive transcriptional activator SoxR|nr:MerR family transcriptional regulator [Solirubrobacteraceae bacterium]